MKSILFGRNRPAFSMYLSDTPHALTIDLDETAAFLYWSGRTLRTQNDIWGKHLFALEHYVGYWLKGFDAFIIASGAGWRLTRFIDIDEAGNLASTLRVRYELTENAYRDFLENILDLSKAVVHEAHQPNLFKILGTREPVPKPEDVIASDPTLEPVYALLAQSQDPYALGGVLDSLPWKVYSLPALLAAIEYQLQNPEPKKRIPRSMKNLTFMIEPMKWNGDQKCARYYFS